MKVFVSSLIGGYEPLRQAARDAVTSLGHDPVMAEDFRAQAHSSQVACLQGLRSAEMVVLILVDRYGTPQLGSGVSPTHEEYLEARSTKPILLFVQEGVDPEPRQAEFLREAQGWQGGMFREGFGSAEQLRTLITRAIHSYELSHASAPLDTQALARDAEAMLGQIHRDRGQDGPILRFAVAGGPARQLLRPAELENEALSDAIQRRAMFDSPRLFEREAGAQRGIDGDALVLEQEGGARIALKESGHIELRLPLERRSRRSRGNGGLMLAIIEESVVRELANAIAFSAWVLDHLDATQRIAHVAMAAKIEASDHLGWRTQAKQDASPNSGTMRSTVGNKRSDRAPATKFQQTPKARRVWAFGFLALSFASAQGTSHRSQTATGQLFWLTPKPRFCGSRRTRAFPAGAGRACAATCNARTRRSPMQTTMMDVPLSLNHLLDRAGRYFGASQIVSRRPDKSLVQHSYAQWFKRTRALAAALQTLGLKKGDRVATLCWNHHAHLECYFGIPAAGGVMHTLNLRLAPAEIGAIAADAQDRFLIVDDILLPLAHQFLHLHSFERVIVFPFSGAAVAPEYTNYETLLADADEAGFSYAPHEENDPVSMCYTSGTTGSAKGVVYSHRSTILHTLVGNQPDYWCMRNTDVLMPVAPMFHANAWGTPYAAVMMGVKFVFPGPHLHADDLLDLMQLQPPTLALGVPTIWMSLIQAYERALTEQPGRWTLPVGLRSLVGGAAVPEALIRAFHRHGVWLLQGWGMTETSPLATVSYPRQELADAGLDERYRRAAMAGVPAPLVDLRINVEDSAEAGPAAAQKGGANVAPDGVTMGEVQVRGPFITGAYHGVPPTSDKFTSDGFLRTGDVATIDVLGFVRITDRTKDLIKSGGEWISSVDLENALMAHPAIAVAAVIAIPDDKWSERPLACVVFKRGASATPQALNEHLLQFGGFAKWQLPERYEFIAAVPRTSTGKFWKLKLREQFPR